MITARSSIKWFYVLLVVFFCPINTAAVYANGTIRLSGRAAVSMARNDFLINNGSNNASLTQYQQSVRLMASQRRARTRRQAYWSVQTIFGRSEIDGSETLFDSARNNPQSIVAQRLRHRSGAGTIFSRRNNDESVEVDYLIDRAFYQLDWNTVSIKVGRQAVDFGVGRLWQPLNVFGAFAPSALDVDYKPGIDALKGAWFKGVAFEVNLLHVVGPNSASDATAVMGRHTVGDQGQWLWLAASLPGGMVYGAGVESEWQGWGWRIASSYGAAWDSESEQLRRRSFWIAGLDRQVTPDSTVTVEWYRHGAGVNSVGSFRQLSQQPFAVRDLQPLNWADTTKQVGARDQLGLVVTYAITPLTQLQWVGLASRLRDKSIGQYRYSFANQLSFLISLNNESDLLFAVFKGTGTGLSADGLMGSDYGHIPLVLSVRWRYYF